MQNTSLPVTVANQRRASRILLVAQDPAFEAAISYVLHEAGFKVSSAPTARDALASIAELPPEHVLFDLDREETDGFGFIHEVVTTNPDVSMLVNSHDPSLAQLDPTTRKGLGIDAVVQRPCRLETVLGKLDELEIARAANATASALLHAPTQGKVARLSLARVASRANVGM